MPQTITLNLPDNFAQPLQRVALAARLPVEQLLLRALQATLPPLDNDLPPAMRENLTALETLDDARLWRVLRETVPARAAAKLHKLLAEQQERPLDEGEQSALARLQEQADLVMLRKARAAVLLRFRGQRIPTLAELSQMSGPLR
jgi:hypothetical protein